jgi:hypothetical protein
MKLPLQIKAYVVEEKAFTKLVQEWWYKKDSKG